MFDHQFFILFNEALHLGMLIALNLEDFLKARFIWHIITLTTYDHYIKQAINLDKIDRSTHIEANN
jgi:hypothetical protein